MLKETTESGFERIEEIDWGSHICHFYEKEEELYEVVRLFFKSGLERGDMCLWATDDGRLVRKVERALRQTFPQFGSFKDSGQFRVTSSMGFYYGGGLLRAGFSFQCLEAMEQLALDMGYGGLRFSGDPGCLKRADMGSYIRSEWNFNLAIRGRRMMALCTSSIDSFGPQEMLEIEGCHAFTLMRMKGGGKWCWFQNSANWRPAAIEIPRGDGEDHFRALVSGVPDVIMLVDREGKILFINRTLPGYTAQEVVGTSGYHYLPRRYHSGLRKALERVFGRGETCSFEHSGKDGTWWVARFVPCSRHGRIESAAVVSTDVTALKDVQKRMHRSQRELRELTAYVDTVREQERISIAREIHDDLGQAMAMLKLDLASLRSELPAERTDLAEKADATIARVGAAVKAIQKLSSELRPKLLDVLDFSSSVEWEAEEFQKRMGIPCVVSVSPRDLRLDRKSSFSLFRILQECLTNVARHACASHVQVRLEERGRWLELSVEDDGRGITKSQTGDARSFGIIGMRERACLLGGTLQIEGSKGKGTVVHARIPLMPPGRGR